LFAELIEHAILKAAVGLWFAVMLVNLSSHTSSQIDSISA